MKKIFLLFVFACTMMFTSCITEGELYSEYYPTSSVVVVGGYDYYHYPRYSRPLPPPPPRRDIRPMQSRHPRPQVNPRGNMPRGNNRGGMPKNRPQPRGNNRGH